jgi:hypothetical protein
LIEKGTFVFKSLDEEKAAQEKLKFQLAVKDVIEHNWIRYLYNYSPLRLVYGSWEYKWTEAPVDLGRVMEILCRVHGTEVNL